MAKSNTSSNFETVLELFSEFLGRGDYHVWEKKLPGTWNDAVNAQPEHEYNTWLRMQHGRKGSRKSNALEGSDHWTDTAFSTHSAGWAASSCSSERTVDSWSPGQ